MDLQKWYVFFRRRLRSGGWCGMRQRGVTGVGGDRDKHKRLTGAAVQRGHELLRIAGSDAVDLRQTPDRLFNLRSRVFRNNSRLFLTGLHIAVDRAL